jgi:hypothetical protein
VINELTASRQIQRARNGYVAALEKQKRALAEMPAGLDQQGRLVAIDRILCECSEALRVLAEQMPSREQANGLDPYLWAEIEEFRASIDIVRETIAPNRQPILAGIAALQPRQN